MVDEYGTTPQVSFANRSRSVHLHGYGIGEPLDRGIQRL